MKKEVEISSLAYGGAGVGRIDGKVVFVPYTAPGDTALIEVTEEKKNFSTGRLTRVIDASPVRVDPPCPLFERGGKRCGGCHWQHIDYKAQLEWKGRIFKETLQRIGKIEGDEIFSPPLASPDKYAYRTRARFHVKGSKWGFFEAGSHTVVDLDTCPLLEPAVNGAFERIRSAFKEKSPAGLYEVELGADRKGAVAAAFYIKGGGSSSFDWEGALGVGGAGLKGFHVYVVGEGRGEGRGKGRGKGQGKGLKKTLSVGDTRLARTVSGATILTEAGGFSQVNAGANEILVQKVIEAASIKDAEVVWDLYAGSGNLALPLSKAAKKVIAVEADKDAAACGRDSVRISGGAGEVPVEFIRSRALEAIERLEKTQPNVVILDPPRDGCAETAGPVARARPRRIIYVSCNPPKLARDISFLREEGFKTLSAQALDMFPQTYHFESILCLEPVR